MHKYDRNEDILPILPKPNHLSGYNFHNFGLFDIRWFAVVTPPDI
jgi:hypothetical protein